MAESDTDQGSAVARIAPKWLSMGGLESRSYICGYCDNHIASENGYRHEHNSGWIYICHYCGRPTYFDASSEPNTQTPGTAFGESVKYLPPDVAGLYKESRDCLKVGANTASVLCSRKLLMNMAVSKGAREGLKFVQYIDYLEENRFLPVGGKEWANHIRDRGNEATHEIEPKTRQE